MHTFGIDLGTTTSAIGRLVDGKPHLIRIDGHEAIPSVVYFGKNGTLVGAEALAHAETEPDRTIRSAKRHMGTQKTWDVGDRTVRPEDVSAEILGFLASHAASATNISVDQVVITVPAWFTQQQRQATKRAAKLAGLKVARIINEPTAAMLAYAHENASQRLALVYDWGGGTFDVSLARQDGSLVEILASEGDAHLGGDDVDEGMLSFLEGTLPEDMQAIVASDRVARARVRGALDHAKRELTVEATAAVRVPNLDGKGWDLDYTFEREDLEEVLWPLLQRTVELVRACLAAADVPAEDVQELLLVGGATHLPQVWYQLHRQFGLEGNRGIDPQLAVALGAVVQAAVLDGLDIDSVLVDVAPYSLAAGIAAGGIPGYPLNFVAEVVTPRNSQLPSKHTHLVHTSEPNQSQILLPIYQGHDPDPRKNTLLGEAGISDLPPAPPGELSRPISITFEHDLDGLVSIGITDQLSGHSSNVQLPIDGRHQASIAQRWVEWALKHDLAFGWSDTAPDPANEADQATINEGKALFTELISQSDTLASNYPDDAQRLLALAVQGMDAAAELDAERVRDLHETLSDQMFEAGVYL